MFIVVPVVALLLIGAVIGGGGRYVLNGDNPVDRPNRVGQLYGYMVCLVAIITILFTVSALVGDAFTLSNPLQASRSDVGYYNDAASGSLISFEAFRATHGPREQSLTPSELNTHRVVATEGVVGASATAPLPDTLATAQQRARYEILRADTMSRVHFRTLESMTTSLLVLVIALALFAVHWRWLRRLAAASGMTAAAPG